MQNDGCFLARILVYPFIAAFDTIYAPRYFGHPLLSNEPSLKSLRNFFTISSTFSSVRLSPSLNTPLAHDSLGKLSNCPPLDDTFTILGDSDNCRRGIRDSIVILVP
ncbi:hypothetical protein V8G54_010096 [Vigna mungo]|uniref:Uncharacterized protein n=1 Tax=Vigna mungo TaxID=3915 RepID=A0AAQ3NW16_VIGMU